MTKYNFEFFDFNDVIDLFRKSVNHNISDVFVAERPSDPFSLWCKVHEINPYRTKTIIKSDVITQWRIAEDRENFLVPHIQYEYLISKLIKNIMTIRILYPKTTIH